jgi:hypothetical protein
LINDKVSSVFANKLYDHWDNERRMPKIVQFLHTAVEATPIHENDSVVPWNNFENHRRKFLKSTGKYIDSSDKEVENELTFWGEWEPQSHIKLLKNGKKNFPTYLNNPFLNPSVPNRTHNTDPNVFGKRFKYIVCKQAAFHNVLTNLQENSIILFGSSINGEFCLDTVFVVSKNKTNYSLSSIEELFPEEKRGKYYHASVNPMYDDTNYNANIEEGDSCRIKDKSIYTFYESVDFTEKDNYHGMYSFVPAKIFDSERESVYVFKQPRIELDFIEPLQTQGVNSKECNLSEIILYWNKVIQQVDIHKLLKGTWFKTPELKMD